MASGIRIVLFDFGGVFTDSPFTAFEAMAAEIGAAPGQINELMFGSYAEDGDHPWHRLERGEISLQAARDAILEEAQRRHGLALDIYQLFARMPRDGGLRQAMVDEVRRLRDTGLGTAIITNNVREFSDGWRGLLPVDELFDLVVDSSSEGVRKPGQEIFRRALERAGGLHPQQAVFLDDHPANVHAAEALGIRGIRVEQDVQPAIDVLRRLLAS